MPRYFFKILCIASLATSIAMLVGMPSSRYFIATTTKQRINTAYTSADYHHTFTTAEVAIARQLLPLLDTMFVVNKVLHIQKFLRDTIAHTQNKIVDFRQPHSTSLQYLQDACNQKIVADCGAYTQMMNLFFYANRIPFRRVGVGNIPDTSIGNHVYSEVYIAQKKQWMLTDMTTNKLCMLDDAGNYLNTQQVQDAIVNKNFTAQVHYYHQDTIRVAKWQTVVGDEQRCFLPVVDYAYYCTDQVADVDVTMIAKIKKMFFFVPWQVNVLQTGKANNRLYYCRVGFMVLGIMSGILLFIFGGNKK
jgi:hypothetical protein